MNTILKCEWYWVCKHTRTVVDGSACLTTERIDAAFVMFASEAIAYGESRHPLKPNMILTAYPCRNSEERYHARLVHGLVCKRISEAEHEWEQLIERMN